MNAHTPLTKPQALTVVREFIANELPNEQWYQQVCKHIKAIVLYGSTAKGLNRVGSDIDLMLFMPLTIEEKCTTGEYFYNFSGREINIVIRSIERLRDIAQRQEDLFQKEVFRESVIVQSTDNEISRLLNKIAKIQ